jgi:hypothetical protein
MNDDSISHIPKWVDLEYRTDPQFCLRVKVGEDCSIWRRHGEGRGKYFGNIQTNNFILFEFKLVHEAGRKEYLRELDEIAKGGTCCEQEEIIKGTEQLLVVGFLQCLFKPWNIDVVLENEEWLYQEN